MYTDFGLAVVSDSPSNEIEDVSLSGLAGTVGYWSPEMLADGGKGKHGWEADIWALGMVLFEMSQNKTVSIYYGDNMREVIGKMKSKSIPFSAVASIQQRDLLRIVSTAFSAPFFGLVLTMNTRCLHATRRSAGLPKTSSTTPTSRSLIGMKSRRKVAKVSRSVVVS